MLGLPNDRNKTIDFTCSCVNFCIHVFETIHLFVLIKTTYYFQIQISPDECIHVRIFEPLPHTNEPVSLHSYHTGKTVSDDLEYF